MTGINLPRAARLQQLRLAPLIELAYESSAVAVGARQAPDSSLILEPQFLRIALPRMLLELRPHPGDVSRISRAEELGFECFRPRDQFNAIYLAYPTFADGHDLNGDV